MKKSWCVILSVLLSVLFVVVSSSSDLDPSETVNQKQDLECFVKCGDFKALELRNRELEKSHEEILKQFKTLSDKFDEFKNEISSDCRISLLKPPLRGPPGKPGKDGKQGEKGEPGPKGDRGISALEASITSCSVAMEPLPFPRSNKQSIYPHENGNKVEVLCDFETDGGGWTVIQKRTSGPKEEFKQNWSNYTQGFGTLDGNFWLGLENIHALTQNGDQELRIELEDFEGEKRYAKYSSFSISDASDFYKLTLAGFSGDSTLQDDMTWSHNGQRFTTIDKDNDNYWGVNCAVSNGGGGGFWYWACALSNLNGLYFEKGEEVQYQQGIYWDSWKGNYYSMAKTEMKIRKRKP